MTLFMLDTNAASAAIRGDRVVNLRLEALRANEWCISAVTYSELRFGLSLRPEATKLIRLVEGFLDIAITLAWSKQAAEIHGRLRADFRMRGAPIGDFDEMIAAHALAHNAVLVTGNVQHFGRLAGLSIENWN
jgi:tRNA(fMet)-specific endonuclease VapC